MLWALSKHETAQVLGGPPQKPRFSKHGIMFKKLMCVCFFFFFLNCFCCTVRINLPTECCGRATTMAGYGFRVEQCVIWSHLLTMTLCGLVYAITLCSLAIRQWPFASVDTNLLYLSFCYRFVWVMMKFWYMW